jgi:hypothetical protein
MRDGEKLPSVRLSNLTTDCRFGPHAIMMRKAIKEGMVDRGREEEKRD